MNCKAGTNVGQLREKWSKSTNKNTAYGTTSSKNCFNVWANTHGITSNIERLEPKELDPILQSFYTEAKKQGGGEYKPSSLVTLMAGLDRYLENCGYEFSIRHNHCFKPSRRVLKNKIRRLKELGFGEKPKRRVSITPEGENVLWNCGKLGLESPQAIINTLWLQFSQHFCLRGRQVHRDLKIEDFTFELDNNGIEYLTIVDGVAKKQQGMSRVRNESLTTMYGNGTMRCPLFTYKTYLTRRPEEYRSSGPFYLAINKRPTSSTWFRTFPLGKNTLGDIYKDLVNSIKLHTSQSNCKQLFLTSDFSTSGVVGITNHRDNFNLFSCRDQPLDAHVMIEPKQHAFQKVLPKSDESLPVPIVADTFEFYPFTSAEIIPISRAGRNMIATPHLIKINKYIHRTGDANKEVQNLTTESTSCPTENGKMISSEKIKSLPRVSDRVPISSEQTIPVIDISSASQSNLPGGLWVYLGNSNVGTNVYNLSNCTVRFGLPEVPQQSIASRDQSIMRRKRARVKYSSDDDYFYLHQFL